MGFPKGNLVALMAPNPLVMETGKIKDVALIFNEFYFDDEKYAHPMFCGPFVIVGEVHVLQ